MLETPKNAPRATRRHVFQNRDLRASKIQKKRLKMDQVKGDFYRQRKFLYTDKQENIQRGTRHGKQHTQ